MSENQAKTRKRMFIVEVFVATDKDEDILLDFVKSTSHMSMRPVGPNYVFSGVAGVDSFDLAVVLMTLGCRLVGQHMVYAETDKVVEPRRASRADQCLSHVSM